MLLTVVCLIVALSVTSTAAQGIHKIFDIAELPAVHELYGLNANWKNRNEF